MNEKNDLAKIMHQKIHEIFLKDWDPIGIQNMPEAHDEYDDYISYAFYLLVSKKTQKELFEYLWWIETEHMGLPGNRKLTETISKKLIALYDIKR